MSHQTQFSGFIKGLDGRVCPLSIRLSGELLGGAEPRKTAKWIAQVGREMLSFVVELLKSKITGS